MSWPTLITAAGALLNVVVLTAVGLAVWGHVRWRALEEYEKLADARAQRISELEADTLKVKAQHEKDISFLNSRIEALEAQVAELQKFNQELQRRLSRREATPKGEA